jgi:hypothetical protein
MPRAQDMLFGILGVVVAGLLALHLRVGVFALVGAFGCGSIYVFTGMIPPRTESFGHRVFTSVFLTVVLSCLVLILPGTLGLQGPHPDAERAVLAVAAALPLVAVCFEILRTPRVTQAILRCLLRWLGQR